MFKNFVNLAILLGVSSQLQALEVDNCAKKPLLQAYSYHIILGEDSDKSTPLSESIDDLEDPIYIEVYNSRRYAIELFPELADVIGNRFMEKVEASLANLALSKDNKFTTPSIVSTKPDTIKRARDKNGRFTPYDKKLSAYC